MADRFYLLVDANGSGYACGGVVGVDWNAIQPVAGGTKVEIDATTHAEIAAEYPHYWTSPDGKTVTKKQPLALQCGRFVISAGSSDWAVVTFKASTPVRLWVSGNVESVTGAVKVQSPDAAEILVQVSPDDPNYYTDRRAMRWSARGPGGHAGALVINAR